MAEVIPVSFSVYEELAAFLSIFPVTRKTRDHWFDLFHFWWDENPYLSEENGRGYFLYDKKKIVGFIGNIPTPFQLFGKETIAFNGTSWSVLEEYRKESLKLYLKLVRQSQNSILFSTTASPQVLPIMKALHFTSLPRVNPARSVYFFNFKKVIVEKFQRLPFIKPMSQLVDPIFTRVQSRCLNRGDETMARNIREIKMFDSSFDDLWGKTKTLFSNTNVRTAKALDWLCFKNPITKKRVFGCFHENELLGYMIVMEKVNEGIKVWECMDLWCDLTVKDIVSSLIKGVIQLSNSGSCDMMTIPHFYEKVRQAGKELGMIKMKYNSSDELLKVLPAQQKQIRAENSFFVMQGDEALL